MSFIDEVVERLRGSEAEFEPELEEEIATPARKWAWPALRWSNFVNLQAKLIVPYLVLTTVIALAGIFIVTRLVTSTVRERFVNQLYEASRVTADGFVQRETVHLANLRLMAFTNGVAEGLNSKIMTIKRRACGFRNKHHFKTAVYFYCGGLDLYPR